MQVFKTFMKVTKKRLHISMIYIAAFLAICIAITLSTSETNEFKASKLKISVTDLDDTDASHALVDYISKNNKLIDIEDGKDAVLDSLYYRNADIVLTINEGYEDKLLKGETDGLLSDYRIPGSYTAEFFDSQINSYISMMRAYAAGGIDIKDAAVKAAELSENEIKVETVSFTDKNENDEFDSNIAGFFQYMAYILIVTLIAGMCPTLLVMTGKEIRSRTNCSCVSTASQMGQLALGAVIFAFGIYVLLMAAAGVLFKSMLISEKGIMAIVNGFVFMIFAMMLTLLIAVIAPKEKVVNMIANVFSLGMSFLCGVFVPQYLLGDTVLTVGKFLPAYWYVKANNMLAGINGEVFDKGSFMTCIGMELLFSAIVFCAVIAVSKFKKRSVN